jgi:YVTN family beta-propeller protein
MRFEPSRFRFALTSTLTVFAFAASLANLGANAAPIGTAYVANSLSDSVSVISLATNTSVATITVGDEPHYVALTPDNKKAFVTNFASDTVSVIDTNLQSVVGTINVGDSPSQIVVTKDGARAFVANSGSSSVSVINVSTNSVINTVPTTIAPNALALHPTRNELWIGFGDVGTVLEARSLADYSQIAMDTSFSRLYASGHLVFRPDGSEALGSEDCGLCGRFHRISGSVVSGSIPILQPDILYDNTGAARGVAINPINGVYYMAKVGQSGPNRIVELGGAGRTLTLPSAAQELAVSPDGTLLYATHQVSPGFVSVIDLATFSTLTSIPVGTNPIGIAIAVPEPASSILMAMGFAAIVSYLKKR